MKAVFLKEISAFFSSITAYLVIGLFLLANSIYLWLFPGDNMLTAGYADMRRFFVDAPLLFLLLIPALTMRSFAEEKSLGTLEILLTKPLNEGHLVLAKFFAALFLILVALLPTFIYPVSLYMLGDPPGNLDVAAVTTSYLGLLLLASVYASAGIFASTFSRNQIVALLLGLLFCLLVSEGIAQLAVLPFFAGADLFIANLGIHAHYEGISRGVIDSRDLLYFLSLTLLFLAGARLVLQKRTW